MLLHFFKKKILPFVFIVLLVFLVSSNTINTIISMPTTQNLQIYTPLTTLRNPSFTWGLQWQNNEEPLMEGNGLLFSEYIPVFRYIEDSIVYSFQFTETANILTTTKKTLPTVAPKLLIATCGFDLTTKYPSTAIKNNWTALVKPSYIEDSLQSITHLLHDVVNQKVDRTTAEDVIIVCDNNLLERNCGFDNEIIRCIIWNKSYYHTISNVNETPDISNINNNFSMQLPTNTRAYHLDNIAKFVNINNTCIGFSTYELGYNKFKILNYGEYQQEYFLTNTIASDKYEAIIDIATIGFKKGYGDYKIDISANVAPTRTNNTSLHQMLADVVVNNSKLANKSTYDLEAITIICDNEQLAKKEVNKFNRESERHHSLNLGRCVIWNNSDAQTVELSKERAQNISYNYFYIDMNNVNNRDSLIYHLEQQLDSIKMTSTAYYQLYLSNGDKPYTASSRNNYDFIINKLYEINPAIVRMEADLYHYKNFIGTHTLVNALKFGYNVNFYHYSASQSYENARANLYCKLLSNNTKKVLNDLQLITCLEQDTTFVIQKNATLCNNKYE